MTITDKPDRDDFQGNRQRMKKIEPKLTKAEHLEMSRKAWDAYHPHYTSFKLKKRPDFHQSQLPKYMAWVAEKVNL